MTPALAKTFLLRLQCVAYFHAVTAKANKPYLLANLSKLRRMCDKVYASPSFHILK